MELKYSYHYTHAINLLYGLHEAIRLVIQEGLTNIVDRHEQAKSYLEQSLLNSCLNLKFLIPNPEHRLAGILSVIIPSDIDGAALIKHLDREHNIQIGGSLLANIASFPKVWRLGYLGVNADKRKIDILVRAFKQAILAQRGLVSKL